jgi:hypothetical protein
MREHGVRFGSISTYEETVALKISKQPNGKFALYYSQRIPHTQEVLDNDPTGTLSKVSVRLIMMYLIYRASHDDGTWSLDTSQIPSQFWTTNKKNGGKGKEATRFKSPFVSSWDKRDTKPEICLESSDSDSSEDHDDHTFIDLIDNADTPSKPRTRPHNLRSTSNHVHKEVTSQPADASEVGEVTDALSQLSTQDER